MAQYNTIVEEDSAGTHAPNFEFTTDSGQKVQLFDYKGEVVYISFWASWCGPCIQGFEKYADIRKEMADAGVVLLNISIDKNEQNWKDAVSKLKIEGKHGIIPQSELRESYQLYNIPRYEIMGKEGEFLYLNRDGGKSVLDNFKEFIAK